MSCFSCMSGHPKDVSKIEDSGRIPSIARSVDSSGSGRGKKSFENNGSGRGKKSFENSESGNRKSASNGNINCSNNAKKANAARSFTFRELATATRNFKPVNLIGEGGFGRLVAVKQLDQNSLQGNQEFIVEVLMLSLLHHSNLVNLIGYCTDGDQRLLVYEYMPMGSLEDHLFYPESDKDGLDWNTRIKIAVGAARGLEYLHCKANPPVIYRDLKSANILLDNDFHPKLSDFGLAKLGPVGDKTHVSTRARPFFKDRRMFIHLADPLLLGRFPVRSLHHAIAITAMCLQEQPTFRPLISDVVVALEYLASQPYTPETVLRALRTPPPSAPSQWVDNPIGDLDGRKVHASF
ncbi:hypothetical protein GIB67_036610 [Kingdonia uniflora]|uniref:Protein kinase domain-containing protein n=1 Tax=Kingdonia uniflora TaxID=39325 RepID=A0A7J7M0K3_9MAGN|nr:hypothetical protein GIB67_036610 [Kingdonia uniflora]